MIGNDGNIYIDNHATIWRWRDAYQNDFTARMDWCTQPTKGANHPPVPAVDSPLEVTVQVGEQITLSAVGSTDPDGDALQYKWIHYPEPGNFWYYHWIPLKINHDKSPQMTLEVDSRVQISEPQYTHIILQVTDEGPPTRPLSADYCQNIASRMRHLH